MKLSRIRDHFICKLTWDVTCFSYCLLLLFYLNGEILSDTKLRILQEISDKGAFSDTLHTGRFPFDQKFISKLSKLGQMVRIFPWKVSENC